ncbi:ATP-binding protein [Candidatus Babeliales bacterium]|nr:ATP-binding protein [Candidatus Babeliales bacterium]
MNTPLGYIIEGSLTDGFVMRVAQNANLEEIKAGKFVAIAGDQYTYFSMITNLTLQVTHPDILLYPPMQKDNLLRDFLKKKNIYATAQVKPMIALDKKGRAIPVKTVPQHFASVVEASEQDVAAIFGSESDRFKKYFNMGNPIDMATPVCIDLEKLAERSTGVFGKSGTGKTFLTRLLLAGLMKKNVASTIIFDMHNEYGVQARQESDVKFVKGLKSLFPSTVVIFSLDPEVTRQRGVSPDVEVRIGYNEITVDDLMSLENELNLHRTALEAAHLIVGKYKDAWLLVLLERGVQAKEFAEELGANVESIAALYRKLKRIEKLPFFVPEVKYRSSVIDRLMEYVERGNHVVIEFGNQSSTFCYLLVANILTRRIRSEYVHKTEKYLKTQNPSDQPRQLMIVIEEAHKFLNPTAAAQTIFGKIAREMRKYFVTLFVIDQRPSGIDSEVLSQIGTKIVAQLSDEKDIQAVLMGAANATTLRTVLGSLDTKKQALLLGHAIAMPMVIETRTYDETFYAAMQDSLVTRPIKQTIDELF